MIDEDYKQINKEEYLICENSNHELLTTGSCVCGAHEQVGGNRLLVYDYSGKLIIVKKGRIGDVGTS